MPRKVATSTLVKNWKPCDGDDTIPTGPEKIMIDEISYTYKERKNWKRYVTSWNLEFLENIKALTDKCYNFLYSPEGFIIDNDDHEEEGSNKESDNSGQKDEYQEISVLREKTEMRTMTENFKQKKNWKNPS